MNTATFHMSSGGDTRLNNITILDAIDAITLSFEMHFSGIISKCVIAFNNIIVFGPCDGIENSHRIRNVILTLSSVYMHAKCYIIEFGPY